MGPHREKEKKKVKASLIQRLVPDFHIFRNKEYRAVDKAVRKNTRTD